MFGFYNYNKPGKGVQKRDPNQPRMSLFFELFFRKLWDLCKVNLLYILLAVPAFLVTMLVVGVATRRATLIAAPIVAEVMGLSGADLSDAMLNSTLLGFDLGARVVLAMLFGVFLGLGPATAGITYVLRNYGREEHAFLWSDAWGNIKSNFKQASCVWLIDLAVFYLATIALDFYGTIGGWATVAKLLLLFGVVLYLMIHIYVYQIMITFELPFKYVVRNSFIMSLMTAPKTLLLLLLLAVVHIGVPLLLVSLAKTAGPIFIFVLLEILFLPAASLFTTNFFIYNTVEKYIKEALSEAEEKNASEE